MSELHEKLPVSTVVQVLRQASKVYVMKRDFSKAKRLMYQALSRAYQYYGPENYRLAALLLDFGFYLLNSDQIKQSVVVYWVRDSMFKNTIIVLQCSFRTAEKPRNLKVFFFFKKMKLEELRTWIKYPFIHYLLRFK